MRQTLILNRHKIAFDRSRRIGKLALVVWVAWLLLHAGQIGLVWASKAAGAPVANPQAAKDSQPDSLLLDKHSVTPTVTAYLPAIVKDYDYYPRYSTGAVGSPNDMNCSGTFEPQAECFYFDVTCQGLEAYQAELRVTDPISNPIGGTMLFFVGAGGQGWWGDYPANNAAILNHLRQAGFRTVEVRWQYRWFVAHDHSWAGMSKTSCRPATVMRWVDANLHDPSLPYCAAGHSNGASQVGYSLVYYGMGEALDAAVLESGPNWTRIDKSCLCDDPAFANICWQPSGGDLTNIDYSYGEAGAKKINPCLNKLTQYRGAFIFDSLVNEAWRYQYSATLSFVFGELDASQTDDQGKLYYAKLMELSPSNVFSTTVPGADHWVTNTMTGTQVVEDALLNTCKLP